MILPASLSFLRQLRKFRCQVAQAYSVGVDEKLVSVFGQLESEKMVWHTK